MCGRAITLLKFFLCVSFTRMRMCVSAQSRAVLPSWRGKNGLCVFCSVCVFSCLLSWRLVALCSLAPLCGSFLTVQPSAFTDRSCVEVALAQFAAAAQASPYNMVSSRFSSCYHLSFVRGEIPVKHFPVKPQRLVWKYESCINMYWKYPIFTMICNFGFDRHCSLASALFLEWKKWHIVEVIINLY